MVSGIARPFRTIPAINLLRWAIVAVSLMVLWQPIQAQAQNKVLFVNPGYRDIGFWKDVSNVMQAASETLGFELEIVSADRDPHKMLMRGKRAIAKSKADYLILVNEHQLAPALMQAANEKRLPTLLLLNDLTDAQKSQWGAPGEKFEYWIGSIVPDNFKAGQEMAISVIRAARAARLAQNGKINMLALGGDDSTPASIARINGLKDVLNTNADIHLLDLVHTDWSQGMARQETEKRLADKRIDIVWAANDQIAFGAMQALKAQGQVPGKTVFVNGMNWSPPAINLVIDGQMTLTHGGHFLAGGWAMVLLADYRQHGVFGQGTPLVQFNMQALQHPLVRKYKTLLGDSRWQKIDFSRFLPEHYVDGQAYDFSLGRLLRNIRQ